MRLFDLVSLFAAEYVLSLAGMSEENFKEAITDQYSDLYWDEDLLHEMYEAVTEGQQTRRLENLNLIMCGLNEAFSKVEWQSLPRVITNIPNYKLP